MAKIQRVSSYLVIVFNVLMVWFILPPIIIWGFPDTAVAQFFWEGSGPVQTPEGWVYLNQVKWTALSSGIGLAGSLFSVIPVLWGLIVLKSIFRNYKQGAIFTTVNARHYRTLGWLFFMDALLIEPVSSMIEVLSITLSNPPGQRYISLNFGTPGLENLFYGLLILVISWVMLEASKLQEDQQLTI